MRLYGMGDETDRYVWVHLSSGYMGKIRKADGDVDIDDYNSDSYSFVEDELLLPEQLM